MSSHKPLPPEIEAKISLLAQHRCTIESLSCACDKLEQEIFSYRASVTPPIKKFPEEILVMTFQHYLTLNSRLIRRLLQVCKLWYFICTNSPFLWTNIPIHVDTTNVLAKTVYKSISPRINTFLRNSQSLLLNIDIDLSCLLSVEEYVNKQEEAIKRRICPGIVLNILEDDDNYEAIVLESDSYPWNPSHIVRLIRSLTGHQGSNMQRWGSFRILLPNDGELSYEVLKLFKGSTPHLKELHIRDRNLSWDTARCFPDTSSLRSLTLRSKLPCIADLASANVEHLSISGAETSRYKSIFLRSWTSLITLEIWTAFFTEGTGRSTANVDVHLPLLQKISFRGGSGPTDVIQFKLPALQSLFIERSSPKTFKTLPKLSPKTIDWFILDKSGVTWSDEDIQEALDAIVQTYNAMEELKVSAVILDSFDAFLQRIKQAGTWPAKFKSVHIVDDLNHNRILDTRTY